MAIVTPFVQVGTNTTRNFANFVAFLLLPPFSGNSIKSLHPIFYSSSSGQESHPLRRLSSLQSAVFLINSRSHRFFATPLGSIRKGLHLLKAHLLPKLRCQFAEFLLLSSLKRLRILISRTSVGLRYGRI